MQSKNTVRKVWAQFSLGVYLMQATLALSKFTSGISRSDARDGPRSFLPVAFFIALPLVGRSASRADDADLVLGLLDEDNEQNTPLLGLTDQNRAHGPVHHPTSRRAGL